MHILILGGSQHTLGGVEAFAERAEQALCGDAVVRVTRIATGTAFLSIKRLPFFLAGLARLTAYRRYRPDVVWLQYVNLPDLTYLLVAKLLGLRVIVTPHLGSNWRSQQSPMLRSLSAQLLRITDRFALLSRTQELEINLPPDVPRSQIRNFLSSQLLSSEVPGVLSTEPVLELVHSGRLSAGKGTFLFLEVCSKLKQAGVLFRARITGAADAVTLEEMKSMIRRSELGREVHILGRVPDQELLDVLKSSDVLIHLSRIDSYPLIVLESMACSCLPVCMELAGARDMIETYDGFVVSAIEPVAETVVALRQLDLQQIRQRGRSAALAVRRDYAWNVCAEALNSALGAVSSRIE